MEVESYRAIEGMFTPSQNPPFVSPPSPSPSCTPSPTPTSPLLTSPTLSPPSESATSYEPESQNNMVQPSDDVLNASLYHNASISLVTSLLLIMSFALKHNLTDAALQDLLQLILYLIPKPNICVTSLYSFKKTFNATQLKSTCFHYCKTVNPLLNTCLHYNAHYVEQIRTLSLTLLAFASKSYFKTYLAGLASLLQFSTALVVTRPQE